MKKLSWSRWTILAGLAVVLLVSAAKAQDFPYVGVEMPDGEKAFLPFPDYPSIRLWRYRTFGGDLNGYTTANSVGPDSALLLFMPKGGKRGEVMHYQCTVSPAQAQQFKGLSFWFRGDGGNGSLLFSTAQFTTHRTAAVIKRIPLSEKKWVKHFVPFNQFKPDVSSTGFQFLSYKFEGVVDRDAWAILARINLYNDETTEAIQPVQADDPAGEIPAEKFISPSAAELEAMIPKTMAKLKAKQPVTIVAAGESNTAGNQMWYKIKEENPRDPDPFLYFSVLSKKLAAHYGYTESRSILKAWQKPDQSGRTPGGRKDEGFDLYTKAKPEEDGTLPFNGLQVIGVGAGGRNTPFGLAHLSDVTCFKPDLVLWTYATNDVFDNRMDRYEGPCRETIEELKKQGIEVMISSAPPYVGGGADQPRYVHAQEFEQVTATIAKEMKIPYVNLFAATTARGLRYIGDIYGDIVHWNEFGHELIGTEFAAALGVPKQLIWDRPLFRARAEGAVIPAKD